MVHDLNAKLQTVDAEKAKLNAARPLPFHTAASLRDKLTLEWIYHSNAIEGNSLTLRETKVVLEGIAVGGKSLREHLEAINHHAAILYLEKIVAKQEPLTAWQIKNIHSLVVKGIGSDDPGCHSVVTSDASTTLANVLHQGQEMHQLIVWYGQAGQMHPIERAAELHTRFVKIYPFMDGNGLTSRLLLNVDLMRAGYPPAVIQKEERVVYYQALQKACLTGVYDDITALVAEAVQRSLAIYLALLQRGS